MRDFNHPIERYNRARNAETERKRNAKREDHNRKILGEVRYNESRSMKDGLKITDVEVR